MDFWKQNHFHCNALCDELCEEELFAMEFMRYEEVDEDEYQGKNSKIPITLTPTDMAPAWHQHKLFLRLTLKLLLMTPTWRQHTLFLRLRLTRIVMTPAWRQHKLFLRLTLTRIV